MLDLNRKTVSRFSTLGAAILLALLLNACETLVSSVDDEKPIRTLPSSADPSTRESYHQKPSRLSLLEQLERLDGKWLGASEHNDLWVRMHQNFALSKPETLSHPNVQKFVRWYSRYPSHIQQAGYRATPYLHYIVNEVEKRSMPAEIALLPMIESAFDPFAHSYRGAAGIWQIMSTTGKRFGLQQDWWYDGRRDIVASTQAALDYLQYLHDMLGNDWLLALAAYNAGEGAVQRAMEKNQKRQMATDFFHLDLPQQTKDYVPKLLALASIIRTPSHYQVDLPSIDNQPYLETVKLNTQIDLAYAAKLADIDLKLLYRLNPGFNRWATHPNGPQDLVLPNHHAQKFQINLARTDVSKLTSWQRYQVQSGDTLNDIATAYKTSMDELRYVNNLKTSQLSPGQYLLIPGKDKKSKIQIVETQNRLLGKTDAIVHVVRQGDSLWSISQKYKISIERLAVWNQMPSSTVLKPGQRLIIKS